MITEVLLATGFLFSVVLLILLIILSREQEEKPKSRKVKEDIKKIKEQVNEDD